MTTLAWLLLLIGGLIVRQVSKGRVMNVGEDLSDAFLAIIQGDTGAFNAVLARTGDDTEPAIATLGDALGNATMAGAAAVTAGANATAAGVAKFLTGAGETLNTSYALAAVVLGEKAKGYKFGATGPDYYDCSGLMTAAARLLGYKGSRFSTFTIGSNKAFMKIQAPAVQGPGSGGSAGAGINDLVVWPTHHMGVITGPNKFYSARSVKSGIGESPISGFRPENPVYYRYKG